MAFILLLLTLVIVVQIQSRRHALTGIEYGSFSSKRLVAQEEEFDFVTLLTNRSSRFVPFLRIDEYFPQHVHVKSDHAPLDGVIRERTHSSSAFLMPKSQLERRKKVSISKRGCYVFSGANLVGGDFLGLSSKEEKYFYEYNQVVVYPKGVESPELFQMLGGFLGDVSVRRFILEDPVLMAGAREYTGNEPFKQMSWKHTARVNQLMVKKFDYTLEPKITVLVDSELEGKSDEDEERIEKTFSLASSVFHALEEKKVSYDFICNAFLRLNKRGDNYLPEGLGKEHFDTALDWLGRATYMVNETLGHTLEKLRLRQEGNRSTILIVPERNAKKEKLIEGFRQVTKGSILVLYGEDFLR